MNLKSKKANTLLKLLLGLGFFFAHSHGFASANKSRGLSCAFLGPIQGVYFNQHIAFSGLSRKAKAAKRSQIEEKTINQYVKKLDGSKLYLLQKDVDLIKKSMKGIMASVEKRPQPDCSRLVSIQDIFSKRVKERVAFAKKYLGKSFKLKKDTKFVLDPDHRKYPKTAKEAEEFQKKYIQFQVTNFLVTDMSLKEAKGRVIRRYERNQRRVTELSQDRIYSSYLDAFSHSMDPHSSYFSADMMEDFRIQMGLSLEGIGATLSNKDGFTVVEQLIPGGAAARSGKIKPKDKIVAVGQLECEKKTKDKEGKCPLENVVEVDLRDVVKKIRGKKGSKVLLKILREEGGKKKKLDVTLVRDRVKLEDEAAAISYIDREVEGKKIRVGLINLPSFYADSRDGGRSAAKDMKKLLKQARKKNVDVIALDFSSNGGGSLDDAVKIAGLFFKTGAVVKQSAKRGNETLLKDEDSTVDFAGPVVVLTSRISASASEIVAGTLQDYNRAVVVGADHTFGKGSVQSVIPLPPGLGAAKVTVGMFYTPSGNSTQHRGVSADIAFPSVLSTDEIGEKTLDYSLPPSSLAQFRSKSAYVTKGSGAWKKVKKEEIEKLRTLSNLRVAKSEDFKKIIKDLEKAKKEDHVVKISETLKAKEDSKKKKEEKKLEKDALGNVTKEAKLAEYLKRADIQEAINIAVDLAALRKGVEIKLGAKYKKAKTAN